TPPTTCCATSPRPSARTSTSTSTAPPTRSRRWSGKASSRPRTASTTEGRVGRRGHGERRPGASRGAPFSLIDGEHLLGYTGNLDVTPDRAPLREFVVAAQLGEPGQPAGPARIRGVGGVEATLGQGEPGLAIRPFQLP